MALRSHPRARRPLALWSFVVVLASVAFAPARVRAQDSVFHPDLEQAVLRLDQARGPEAYAAMRRLWALWDRADPTHIEELLLGAEQRVELTPAARVYAALLGAFARAARRG